MTIYLYVKTHTVTGLKYLGKTTAKDPCKYKGSGKYWKEHIKKYGYNVSTRILLVTDSSVELKETGLFFSKLWGVVESDEWANLKPEEGDGGGGLNLIGGDVQRKTHAKRKQINGYHHLIGGDIQRSTNMRKVNDGTHNFLGKTNNSLRVNDGAHNFLGGNLQKSAAREKVLAGTHPMQNVVSCIDKAGNLVRIPKEVYYSTHNKIHQEFVHIRTNEAKMRKELRKPL